MSNNKLIKEHLKVIFFFFIKLQQEHLREFKVLYVQVMSNVLFDRCSTTCTTWAVRETPLLWQMWTKKFFFFSRLCWHSIISSHHFTCPGLWARMHPISACLFLSDSLLVWSQSLRREELTQSIIFLLTGTDRIHHCLSQSRTCVCACACKCLMNRYRIASWIWGCVTSFYKHTTLFGHLKCLQQSSNYLALQDSTVLST